jgi:hypothetical protein
MYLISIRAARRTLGRFVFASTVSIALSTTFTTPQSTVALQAVVATSWPLTGRAAFFVAPAAHQGSAGVRDNPALTSDFVGVQPGPGWG